VGGEGEEAVAYGGLLNEGFVGIMYLFWGHWIPFLCIFFQDAVLSFACLFARASWSTGGSPEVVMSAGILRTMGPY
jgi:hypothetical protein